MIEVITAIALLCQVAPAKSDRHHSLSMTVVELNNHQLKCQQEYLRCVMSYEDKTDTGVSLSVCLLKRGKK